MKTIFFSFANKQFYYNIYIRITDGNFTFNARFSMD